MLQAKTVFALNIAALYYYDQYIHDYGATSSKLIFHGLVFFLFFFLRQQPSVDANCQNRIYQFSNYFSYEVDAKQRVKLKY